MKQVIAAAILLGAVIGALACSLLTARIGRHRTGVESGGEVGTGGGQVGASGVEGVDEDSGVVVRARAAWSWSSGWRAAGKSVRAVIWRATRRRSGPFGLGAVGGAAFAGGLGPGDVTPRPFPQTALKGRDQLVHPFISTSRLRAGERLAC
jgi:hypothetical protein